MEAVDSPSDSLTNKSYHDVPSCQPAESPFVPWCALSRPCISRTTLYQTYNHHRTFAAWARSGPPQPPVNTWLDHFPSVSSCSFVWVANSAMAKAGRILDWKRKEHEQGWAKWCKNTLAFEWLKDVPYIIYIYIYIAASPGCELPITWLHAVYVFFQF